MSRPLPLVGLRFSTGHSVVLAALAPLGVLAILGTRHQRWGIGLLAALVVLAFVAVRGRRLTEWVMVALRWIRHRRKPLVPPSEPVVGATVMPGDHVAIRWHGDVLVALVELVARPFTPTVVVDGGARSDDVLDTSLVAHLLSVHCPDVEAEVVSAGYRGGHTAPEDVVGEYQDTIGSDPAPVYRRTWIVLRADPSKVARSALRRDIGVPGLVRYLTACATRIADGLAGHGVDARCARSFDGFDRATEIDVEREKWSYLKGRKDFSAVYVVAGGPDVWWSVPAQRTVTRLRISADAPPRSSVLLTTSAKPATPKRFSRLIGTQRRGLSGMDLLNDRHWRLPIGSAGLLVGETARGHRVYLPIDDADTFIEVADGPAFARFVVRAAAADAQVTLRPVFGDLARLVGAGIGPEARVVWPQATTYFEPRPGLERVVLGRNSIGTPRNREIAVHPVELPKEGRYLSALPSRRRAPVTVSTRGE